MRQDDALQLHRDAMTCRWRVHTFDVSVVLINKDVGRYPEAELFAVLGRRGMNVGRGERKCVHRERR